MYRQNHNVEGKRAFQFKQIIVLQSFQQPLVLWLLNLFEDTGYFFLFTYFFALISTQQTNNYYLSLQ